METLKRIAFPAFVAVGSLLTSAILKGDFVGFTLSVYWSGS